MVSLGAMTKIGVGLPQLESMVSAELSRLPSSQGSNLELTGSAEIMKVFGEAQKLADSMQDEFVSTEHLLLALTKVDDAAKRLLGFEWGRGSRTFLKP